MRLDKLVSEKNKISRTKAQELIKNGFVFVCDKAIDKPAFEVEEESDVRVEENQSYVSRGAYKLLGAIDDFNLNFKDKVVLDIGASTGGFTQVALDNGAKKVYAVDIGENELFESLKKDKRVVNYNSTDFRNLKINMCPDVQMIIGDVSFISLKHIFPKIKELFGCNIEICILFKPQFECGKELAKKYKGVVIKRNVHLELLKDFCSYLEINNFLISGLSYSKIKGKSGNIEYLFYLNGVKNNKIDVLNVVESAFNNIFNKS